MRKSPAPAQERLRAPPPLAADAMAAASASTAAQTLASGGTTGLRSKAEFLKKLREFDLFDHRDIIVEPSPSGMGLWNMQRMSQVCGMNPDRVDQTHVDQYLEEPLKTRLKLPADSALDVRALYWDCVHASIQERKQRFSINRDEVLLPLNERERKDRRCNLRDALRQVLPHAFTGLLDPAHSIEDDLHDCLMSDKLLTYLGPDECPTREDEQAIVQPRSRRGGRVAQGVPDEIIQALAKLVAPEKPKVPVNLSSIHLLDHAFMRRGMCMHTVGIMPWSSHEFWRQKMMGSLYLQPLREGFVAPDITSVLCADRAIWKFLTKACADRITPEPSATDVTVLVYPLVNALDKAFEDNEIKDYLRCQPRHLMGGAPRKGGPANASAAAAAVGAKAATGTAAAGTASKEAKKVKKKDKKNKAKAKAKAQSKRLAKLERQVAKGGGKGGGRPPPAAPTGADAERRPKVPRGLLPKGQANAPDGTSYCFGYNLGTCPHTDVAPGQKCTKGLHKCCCQGCGQTHPMKGNH